MRVGRPESEFVKPKKRDLPYETMDDEGGDDVGHIQKDTIGNG